VRTVRNGLIVGLVAEVALLVALAGTVGLGLPGWIAGLACSVGTPTLLGRAYARAGADSLGAANRVTLARAVVVGGVAALVADSFAHSPSVATLVTLAVIALVLDGVDGKVARRTGSSSALGARFDMEVDAFLIFTLSVYVAHSVGWWVLAIGLARYVYVVAGWAIPRLRAPVPPRYWRKTVAAIEGIVLTVAAGRVLPDALRDLVLVVALLVLAESFGRDIWWQARAGRVTRPRSRFRNAAGWVFTIGAFVLVWLALVAPDQLDALSLTSFLRIPIEGLVVVAVGLVLPVRARQVLAIAVGLILGALAILRVLDMAFFATLDRPFNPVSDWGSLGPGIGVLRDSIGRFWADVAVSVAVLLAVAVPAALAMALLRLTRLTARYRTTAAGTVAALAAVWTTAALIGAPVASSAAAGLTYDEVRAVDQGIQDQHRFASAVNDPDRFALTPGRNLLTGLRGKDVLVAFVESYGRVAVQDSSFSPQVDAVLRSGTDRLRAAGFASKSAFLTSPTFGGISWLAHSTLQSGLWIDGQQRYDQLVASKRFTLSDAFKRAGWRTVGDVPSNQADWPEGRSFYHYDQLYDMHNVGYAGPRFSYAAMPDQYTLSALRRMELAPRHAPVMAEIDLVTSHTPWTPLPRMVGWNRIGDGSIYDGMPEQGLPPSVVWRSAAHVQALYGESIQYSLNALISYVTTFHDPNLVLVLLGDHQPAKIVSGSRSTHDVPITIIAHDQAVMDRISSWGWQDGMLPSPQAPVWPMDAFRDRFLTAYGPR
jgi:phosphatidylglycerophosphate synthase